MAAPPRPTATSTTSDGPVLNLINKRLCALRNEQNRIIQMEETLIQGKPLDSEKLYFLINSKSNVVAVIDELEKLQEASLALAKTHQEDPIPESGNAVAGGDSDTSVDSTPTTSKLPLKHMFFYHEPLKEFEPAVHQELANKALMFYLAEEGVKLEISGNVTAIHYFSGRLCGFHLAFNATSEDGDTKMLLAEVFRHRDHGTSVVNFCQVMDPNDPGLAKGCYQCRRRIPHPKGVEFFKIPNPEDFTA